MKIFEYNKCCCLNVLSFDHGPRLFHINLIYRTYPNQEICYPLIQRVGYTIDCYQYNNEYLSFKHNVISTPIGELLWQKLLYQKYTYLLQ